MSSLHFVGFKDDRIHTARRVFGPPDFYHRTWDGRAKSMILDSDVAVFADGDDTAVPALYAWDDSQFN